MDKNTEFVPIKRRLLPLVVVGWILLIWIAFGSPHLFIR